MMILERAKISRLLLGTALTFSLYSPAIWAQTAPTSTDPGRLIQDLGEEIGERPRTGAVITLPEEEAGIEDADTKKIFILQDIQLEGGTVYSDPELAPLLTPYIGQEVSFADLNAIARTITLKYRRDGYVFSQAILPPQKIKDGIVRIDVIEGQISKVTLVGDFKDKNKLIHKYAEKLESSGPANTADMERYLLLMNDLPGIVARSVIKPGASPHTGELIVTIEEDPFEGSLEIDNRGSRYLGRYRAIGVAAANSIFGIHDRTTLRGINSLGEGETDELRFFDVSHEEQIGSEGLRLKGRYAVTSTKPGGPIENDDIEGFSRLWEVDGLYPLIRSRDFNVNLKSGFTSITTETDIADVEISNDSLRYITFGTELDFTDSFRGVTMLNFEVAQGLKILGATDDGTGRSRENGDHDFTRWNVDASRLQDLPGKWSAFFAVSGQYANDPLLSSEEFGIGGGQFGRAYDSGEIVGDHGLASAVELRYGGLATGNEYLSSYQFYGFYDWGATWNEDDVVGEEQKSTAASAGLGTRFNLKYDMTGTLEVAAPLTRDIDSEGSDGDKARVFFSLLKRF